MKNFLVLLSIFVAVCSQSLVAQSNSCVVPTASGALSAAAKEMLKRQQTSALIASPARFCDINMARRYLEANNKDPDSIALLSDKEVWDKAYSARMKENLGGGFVSLPFVEDKKGNFATGVFLPGDGIMRVERTFDETLAQAEKVINSDMCIHESYSRGMGRNKIEDVIKDKGVKPLDDSKALALAEKVGPKILCSELTPTKMFQCGEAFTNSAQKMLQKGSPPIMSMPEVFDKIVNSQRYDEGLKIMANKMLKNLKSPGQVRSDVFTDMKESFRQAGYSAEQAEDLAFDVMGFIATGGTALNVRVSKVVFAGDRWPTITALTTIAAAMPVLDFYTAKMGNIYSFPAGVQGQCDTSKAYHFWMTAYLAREQVKEGIDPEAAAAGAFTVSKAYHVTGNLTNRRQGALLAHRPYSPTTNIVRADLSYASAGAVFGAGADLSKKSINVDKGIQDLLEDAEVLPKQNLEEIKSEMGVRGFFGYRRFHKIFSPNSAFNEFADERSYSKVSKQKYVVKKKKTCAK